MVTIVVSGEAGISQEWKMEDRFDPPPKPFTWLRRRSTKALGVIGLTLFTAAAAAPATEVHCDYTLPAVEANPFDATPHIIILGAGTVAVSGEGIPTTTHAEKDARGSVPQELPIQATEYKMIDPVGGGATQVVVFTPSFISNHRIAPQMRMNTEILSCPYVVLGTDR